MADKVYEEEISVGAWERACGALWIVFSCACFAGVNCLVRHLCSGDVGNTPLPATVVAFFQNCFATLVFLPYLIKDRSWVQDTHRSLHSFRVLSAVLAVAVWYAALAYIPVAEVVALSFMGPVFSVLGACYFLGEIMTWRRALSVVIGFAGAFMVTRPDLVWLGEHVYGWYSFLPLLAAILFVCNKLATRQLAAVGVGAMPLTLHLMFWMTPVSFLPALHEWTWPDSGQVLPLLCTGILASGGQFGFNKAHSMAEVTFLLPFGFSKFVISAALAFILFGEWPQGWLTWCGMLVVILSALILGLEKQRR